MTATSPYAAFRARPRSGRVAAGLGLGLAALLTAGLFQPSSAAAQPAAVPLQQPPPSTFVTEDFKGATAPDFLGVGSACLTGAPQDAPPPTPGGLGGCPEPSPDQSVDGGPVPPPGGNGHGYLQLTDANTDQSGAALYNTAIPAEEGLVVAFEQWQYGPTAEFEFEGELLKLPADGISFFLVDGATELTEPGAFGGSLGYAQKTTPTVPGVDQGYTGIGLDVLGNFFNDGEGRGSGGCPNGGPSPAGTAFPTRSTTGPNMVTVRGSGDGLNGYCFLDATYTGEHDADGWESSLPGQLQGPTTEVNQSDPALAEQDLEESKRTVTVEITPAPNPVMTVWIDFNDGQGFREVLSTPAPEPVPDTYKFGFAASTGVWSDVHLIRNVVVGQPAPELTLDKSVPEDLPLPLRAGDVVPYTYTVTNTGNTELTQVAVTDDRLGNITCPQDTLPVGGSMECTATYVVTEEDESRGYLANTATATARHDDEPVGPVEDSLNLPVGVPGGDIVVDKEDEEGRPLAGGAFELWRETNGRPGLQYQGADPDTLIADCVTPETGRCEFPDQAQGEYYLRETRAPEGFRLPDQTVHGPFTLTAEGYRAAFTNTLENECPECPTCPECPDCPECPGCGCEKPGKPGHPGKPCKGGKHHW